MNAYETHDFYLACYLRCTGFELADVRREGRQSVFVFRDQPKRRETVLSFYNNEGAVPPLALISTIKDMKALIHNA